MHRVVALVAMVASLVAVPHVQAHWVKVDAPCDRLPYVDKDPTDNDLLGPDPSAVVVVHACVPCPDDPNVEPLGYKVFGCGSHL